ncbi:MAG TPA: phosphate acyltransferase PlsX [Bacteroidota bacterium]|nr:phosphate acyltransferase PlsX [Bacteroidota bacterium]
MNPPSKLRIALDAMGGDFAPANEVAGAVAALRESGNAFEVILVGKEPEIRTQMEKFPGGVNACTVVPASEVITMDDSPTAALKQKKDSSLAVGMRMHQEGKAEAFVSAGNTGAVLSATTLILGRVKGVSRPTIGTFIPAEDGVCLVLDAGTNVDCRPRHLYEFAIMGSIYFGLVTKKERPSVALLNVGEEKGKGTEVVNEAYKLLEASNLNFVGNVEGRDILKKKADVVVCDGFVGNIVLKFGESVPGFLKSRLVRYANEGLLKKLLVGLAKGSLKSALRELDPNLEGGVPVLGTNGVSIIGHGSSTVVGIKNMILKAAEVARFELHKHIERAIAASLESEQTGLSGSAG